MMTDTLRADLLHVREAARGGDMAETVRQLDKVLAHIEPDHLLTSTEAAHLLGVRSPNSSFRSQHGSKGTPLVECGC